MRLSSLWILGLGFAVFAVPAHATPRGAEVRETRQGRRDHPAAVRMGEREALTIRWESNGRTDRYHGRFGMRIRNDELAKAFSETYQTGRSVVPLRPAPQSFSVLPGRWREQVDLSTIRSRRFEAGSSSSSRPRILPVGEASANPVPEPTAAMLFGGGLVLVYTLAARRRERV